MSMGPALRVVDILRINPLKGTDFLSSSNLVSFLVIYGTLCLFPLLHTGIFIFLNLLSVLYSIYEFIYISVVLCLESTFPEIIYHPDSA